MLPLHHQCYRKSGAVPQHPSTKGPVPYNGHTPVSQMLPNFSPLVASSDLRAAGAEFHDLGLAAVTAGVGNGSLAKFRHRSCGEPVENIKRRCSHTRWNKHNALRQVVDGPEGHDGVYKRSTFRVRIRQVEGGGQWYRRVEQSDGTVLSYPCGR